MRTLHRWGAMLMAVLGMLFLTVREVAAEVAHRAEVTVLAVVRTGGRCACALRDGIDRVLLSTMSPLFLRTGAVGNLIAGKRAELTQLLGELEAGQKKMDEKGLDQNEGEALTQKAKEAEALQKELDAYDARQKLINGGRVTAGNTGLPATPEEKDKQQRGRKRLFTSPGALFVLSAAFKQYRENGKQGWSSPVDIKSLSAGRVALTGEEAEAFEAKAFDPATLSDLGDDALIETDRDPDVVRFEEQQMPTLEDLLSVVGTNSDAIRFVKITAVERAAASQASRGAPKPYLRMEFDTETVNVENIAVLSKVTEQDIEDAPRMVGIINGEMQLDVRLEKDRQIAWGSGAAGQLLGIFEQGVPEFARAAVGDSLIDTIRRMRTDQVLRRVAPTGVAIHPLEWEEVELAKGSDERYVWAVVQTVAGPRIWSLQVAETESMENPETGERRLVVGDWKRAGTLYNRSNGIRLAIGFVDDDFARNLRTLRAEQRAALALKRPWALTYSQTNAPES